MNTDREGPGPHISATPPRRVARGWKPTPSFSTKSLSTPTGPGLTRLEVAPAEMLSGMVDEDGRRAELMNGLTGPAEADLACRLALEAGATFSMSTDPVSVAALVNIYRRRVRHMRARGMTRSDRIRLLQGSRRSRARQCAWAQSITTDFNFVVFLDEETRLVSCLGVTPYRRQSELGLPPHEQRRYVFVRWSRAWASR